MDPGTVLTMSELLERICAVELTTCSLTGNCVEVHNVIVVNVVSSMYKCVHCDEKFETYSQVSTHVKRTHLEEENGMVQIQTSMEDSERANPTDLNPTTCSGVAMSHTEDESGIAQKSATGACNPGEESGTTQKNPKLESGLVQTDSETNKLVSQAYSGTKIHQVHSKDVPVLDISSVKHGEHIAIPKSLVGIVRRKKGDTEPEAYGDQDGRKKNIDSCQVEIGRSDALNVEQSENIVNENNSTEGKDDSSVKEENPSMEGNHDDDMNESSNDDTVSYSEHFQGTSDNLPRRRKCKLPWRYLPDEDEVQLNDAKSARRNTEEKTKMRILPLHRSMLKTERNLKRKTLYTEFAKRQLSSVKTRCKKLSKIKITSRSKGNKSTKGTKGKNSIKKETSSPSGEKVKVCPICSKTFVNAGTLGAHMRFHNREETIQHCEVCSMRMTSTVELEAHAKTHPSYRPFKCSQCGSSYTSHRSLRKHREMHRKPPSSPKVYYCMECKMKYSNATALKNHASVHPCYNPFSSTPYECGQCDSTFEHSHDLETHAESSHAGYMPFKCTLCGREYQKRADFNEHAQTHSYEALVFCFECNKSFTSRSGLKKHLFTHNKPFECTVCFKTFALINSFNDHKRSHTDERPYLCSDCGKAFRSNSALICHSKIHLKEKPFPCLQCGKAFAQGSALTEHIRRHEGVKSHMCSMCGLAFVTSGELSRHNRRHHKDCISMVISMSDI